MTITFGNDNDVIVYAFKKIISLATNNHYIFLAQSIWWILSLIGLQQGLVIDIDNLKERSEIILREAVPQAKNTDHDIDTNHYQTTVLVTPRDIQEDSRVHNESASTIFRDPKNDKRADQILDRAERFIENSERARNTWQHGQVNPLPQTKKQLKKARKIKWLQDSKNTVEALRR